MNKLQGGQGVPRGTFVKTILMMFVENTTEQTPSLQEMRGRPITIF
jgi:hypothetical protein